MSTSRGPEIALIVAHDGNLLIGRDGGLPWRYPEDMAHFKKVTMGHPILMGRGVFEEIGGKPLPGRRNVVVSRTLAAQRGLTTDVPGLEVHPSLDSAFSSLASTGKIYVIGGGEIYRQTLSSADELIVTLIPGSHDGDVYFPEYRADIGTVWREVSRERSGELEFVTYKRALGGR